MAVCRVFVGCSLFVGRFFVATCLSFAGCWLFFVFLWYCKEPFETGYFNVFFCFESFRISCFFALRSVWDWNFQWLWGETLDLLLGLESPGGVAGWDPSTSKKPSFLVTRTCSPSNCWFLSISIRINFSMNDFPTIKPYWCSRWCFQTFVGNIHPQPWGRFPIWSISRSKWCQYDPARPGFPRWFLELSNEKRAPGGLGMFRLYSGWNTSQLYGDYDGLF